VLKDETDNCSVEGLDGGEEDRCGGWDGGEGGKPRRLCGSGKKKSDGVGGTMVVDAEEVGVGRMFGTAQIWWFTSLGEKELDGCSGLHRL